MNLQSEYTKRYREPPLRFPKPVLDFGAAIEADGGKAIFERRAAFVSYNMRCEGADFPFSVKVLVDFPVTLYQACEMVNEAYLQACDYWGHPYLIGYRFKSLQHVPYSEPFRSRFNIWWSQQ